MGYVSRWGGMDVGSGMLFAAQTVDGLVHQLGGTRLRAECSLVVARRRRGGNNPSRHDVDCYDRCPVGTAVVTSSGGNDLRRLYDAIIHTTPPFYDHPPPSLTMTGVDDEGYESRRLRSRELLGSCYRESFELAFGDAMSDDMVDKREYDLVDRMRNSMRRLLLPRRPKGHSPTSADVVLSRRVNMRVAVPLLGAGCRAFPKDVALDVAANEAASWLLSSSRGSENKDRDGGRNDSVVFGLLEEDDAVYLSARLNRLLLHR
ncbi:hypothetical protein ACHAXA_001033 [Cyclostephanos tholiformis]|uniref:Macro domain-containing protein n=1 Tax=Cyclostephanos tholiformis TaxID=382380 RepID=A0ABD3RW56_9STRA